MKKWLFPIALVVIIAVFLSSYFVTAGNVIGIPFAWLFAIGAVALVGYFGIKQAIFPIFDRKTHGILALLLLVGVFIMGGFQFAFPGAGVTPGPSGPGTVDQTVCMQSVTDEVKGQSVSMVVNAYDEESNTPLSSAVGVLARYYVNGIYGSIATDTTGGSTSGGIGGGDVVTFYGGNASYYVDKAEFCMSKLSFPVQLGAHAVVTETNLAITCYDDTGSTTLDSPSGTYSSEQEDYEFDMGADDEQNIYCKFKVNAANSAHNLDGICIKMYEGTADTLDDVTLLEPGWSEVVAPKYLANTVMALNDTTQTSNTTDGFDKCYSLATPLMLHEWDEVKYEYSIETGGTAPTEDDDATPTSSTLVIIGHLDAVWSRGDDGNEYNDFHDHTSSQANVGLVEELTQPLGKDFAVVIELK